MFLSCAFSAVRLKAQAPASRVFSGTVVNAKQEGIGDVSVTVSSSSGNHTALTDDTGRFRIQIPGGSLRVHIEGKYIHPLDKLLAVDDPTEELAFQSNLALPSVHDSVVIVADPIEPSINRRNDTVYKNTLFARDDQLLFTLDAGINAGQHEGGGKSLEIRRFGYNLDHGGVNGGLKILVDDIQQNQGTQGHGQGYLGSLKSLTPELIDDVDILNGPFNAEYGDFSGLGVVHIRTKESLPQILTVRMQGGSFNSERGFLSYSPQIKDMDSFFAYEASYSDGPFLNPMRYRRDNVTSSVTWHVNAQQAFGFKFNSGRNDFFSSGQIPLDEVAAGRLARFGFEDPFDGGTVHTDTVSLYYRREFASGAILKVDGFLGRSLFDLFSNFTFFLVNQAQGDGIQQHDSRLQEGTNVQYLRPFRLFGRQMLFTAGSNLHDNQINVQLLPRVGRSAYATQTSGHAHVTNVAGYFQQGVDFLNGRLHFDAGLRFDYFRFEVTDLIDPTASGSQGDAKFQPKANISYRPLARVPATFYFNYGRGISSQDARGVVQRPDAPKIATTDFYQFGAAYHLERVSFSADTFLIDRSNEQVYIPDDGTFEFKGPSRAYGFEVKTSVQLTPWLSLNTGLTRVGNSFYRGTSPREYVDSAPHSVANAALTLAPWHSFTGSLRYRHVGSYRLDGLDPNIRASGLDVVDFSASRHIGHGLELNLSVDNLTNKRYFETQNFFESQLRPYDPTTRAFRIHGSPGYPVGVTIGLTYRLGEKSH
jgi:outer membrane receptor protein involved in Fe transport